MTPLKKWLKNTKEIKKKYEAESATVTDLVNGDRSKVQDMQKRIVDFRDNAQNYNKKSDIVKPLMEKS
jgi:outer membrane protein